MAAEIDNRLKHAAELGRMCFDQYGWYRPEAVKMEVKWAWLHLYARNLPSGSSYSFAFDPFYVNAKGIVWG